MLDVGTQQQICQLDVHISQLNSNLQQLLSSISDGESSSQPDLSQLHQRANLEREIRQRKTFLHYLLQGQPRPWHYHRLPPEMLVEICQWITNPTDKLTLAKTFPVVGQLMKWDQGNLYFQLIYPHIYPFICQNDWKTTWNLCKVSAGFMETVLTHQEQILTGAVYPAKTDLRRYFGLDRYVVHENFDFQHLTREINSLEDCPVWMNNMPFLFAIEFRWVTLQNVEAGPDAHIRNFLEVHGQRLWACTVTVNLNQQNENGSRTILQEILSRTPNLRYLWISTGPWPWANPVPGADPPNQNNTLFPNLSHLRFLRVSAGPFNFSLVQQYGPILKQLWTGGDPPGGQNGVLWPLIENYQVVSPGLIRNIFTNSILASPLKSIVLVLNSFLYNTHIPELLQSLSQFGATLEKLRILYEPRTLWTDRGLMTNQNEWMLFVNLPKLWDLELSKYSGKLDWLVVLPALQKLKLRQHLLGEHEDRVLYPDMIHFPKSEAQRFSTNAWTYLKSLKRLYIQVHWDPDSGFWTSRSEHEAHYRQEQQSKGLINKMLSCLPFFPNCN